MNKDHGVWVHGSGRAVLAIAKRFGRAGSVVLLTLGALGACGGSSDGGGSPIAPPRASAWGSAAVVEPGAADVYSASPQIAADGAGNVTMVFTQWSGGRRNILAKRYAAVTGTWGAAAPIETDNAGDADRPQLAADADGNALAVWNQSDGTRNNIWANRYNATTNSWGVAVLIETDNTGQALAPRVAVDASGNGLAVWIQHDGTRNNIWANRYTAGTTQAWGAAVLIETDAGAAVAPKVAIDASGNGLAVWAQDAGTVTHIMSNRFAADTGAWATAASIASFRQGSGGNAQLALRRSGDAVVVWEQYDGSALNIAAIRYAAGSWGAEQLIQADVGATSGRPQVAIDADGNALAVWVQADAGASTIWTSRQTPGMGSAWSPAARLQADGPNNGNEPRVVFDAHGNAFAVWLQGDGMRQNTWANRYAAGSWGTPALIETNDAGSTYDPQVLVDGSGHALAVWAQSESANSAGIWANSYR